MLAGVRNVAWGAAMVMAGLFAVMVANCVWIILSRADALFFFSPLTRWDREADPGIYSWYMPGNTESFLSIAVVIWLIGRAVLRVSKSRAAGR